SLVSRMKKSRLFVFDTETTSTDPLHAELVGISVALGSREAWYIPVSPPAVPAGSAESDGQARLTVGQELAAQAVLESLRPVFADRRIGKIGQNIKYDALVLRSHGLPVEGILFDTMVASYILRPDAQHNLDAMAREHLRYRMISYDELTGTGK